MRSLAYDLLKLLRLNLSFEVDRVGMQIHFYRKFWQQG